jgi:hypothetical protein
MNFKVDLEKLKDLPTHANSGKDHKQDFWTRINGFLLYFYECSIAFRVILVPERLSRIQVKVGKDVILSYEARKGFYIISPASILEYISHRVGVLQAV